MKKMNSKDKIKMLTIALIAIAFLSVLIFVFQSVPVVGIVCLSLIAAITIIVLAILPVDNFY